MKGVIFDVDTFAVHDGPGIRMAVYFKGCPLSCKWCHSPESQRPDPELIFLQDRCVLCGRCAEACPDGMHTVNDKHTIDWDGCIACGICADHCPEGALAIKGYEIDAAELVARAVRMKPFFTRSGGGVTLTGGEVTRQVEFAEEILTRCRAEGIHTAIETCGACDWARLALLAAHTDLILYDLKLIDAAAHRLWTGVRNPRILDNAARLAKIGATVQVRVPLIPGVTDTEENLRRVFDFMRDVGLHAVSLLPYNPSTGAKYEWLGRQCEMACAPQEASEMTHLAAMAQAVGLTATVGA